MKRKISISGTFSAGKTTLSNQIFANIPASVLLSEHAWDVKKLFPDIEWDSQIVRDYMLFSQLVREASIQQTSKSIVICDTGIMEAIAHSHVFGLEPRFELIEKLNHHRYDVVFICDYQDIPIVDNQVRETDPILRADLHAAIVRVAQDLHYEPIFLRGACEYRLHRTLNLIKKNVT